MTRSAPRRAPAPKKYVVFAELPPWFRPALEEARRASGERSLRAYLETTLTPILTKYRTNGHA